MSSKNVAKLVSELGLTYDLLQQGLDLLQKPRYIHYRGEHIITPPAVTIDGDHVALTPTYRAEKGIAGHLRRLMTVSLSRLEIPTNVWGEGFIPHEHQIEAIRLIAQSNVTILTGGPGVGKTTLVRSALRLFQANSLTVLQCAFAGKAANRMQEQTSFPAKTIHRTLGYRGGEWFHTGDNPLPGQVVVVDEVSMIDVELVHDLLDAVEDGSRVLFVGDVDQLPSIGPGRVLHDLIASGEVPTVRLTKIFRQAGPSCRVHGESCPGPRHCADYDPGSRIPYVARAVNKGLMPDDLHAEGTDFRFIERETTDEVLHLLLLAVTKGIPEQRGIPVEDIQVLAAQKTKGKDASEGPGIGIESLNRALQEAINPAGGDHELDVVIGGRYTARVRDKVIHIHNNYDLGVMNGEIGRVVAADKTGLDMSRFPDARTSEDGIGPDDEEENPDADADDADDADEDEDGLSYFEDEDEDKPRVLKNRYVLIVAYDNGSRQVAYDGSETTELLLAYAISIHKAQGSQFPAVVIPVHSAHGYMLTRQLVYTGITRAEKYCLLIGQEDALAKAVRNTRDTVRRTRLQTFLRQEMTGADEAHSSLALRSNS